MKLACLAIVVVTLLSVCEGANILMMLGFCSKSHKYAFWPLAKALAARGHKVTIESSHPKIADVPGITEYNPEKLVKFTDALMNSAVFQKSDSIESFVKIFEGIKNGTDILLENSVTLRQKEHFDMVMMDDFFFDAGLAVAYRHNAIPAYISTSGTTPVIESRVGNPAFIHINPALPSVLVPMNFWERLGSVLFGVAFVQYRYRFLLPAIDEMIRRHVGEDVPPLEELEKEVALNFVNTHFSVLPAPYPYLPNVIEIGGMHCGPAKQLPKDLLEFADGSGDAGFIYVSFGTVVATDSFPEERRLALVNAFGQLKQRVLWKWNSGTMGDIPANIKIVKFAPQQDVLGHPKLRLFITHGGMLSQLETIYHGVPVITVPFFGDQHSNAHRSESSGFGLSMLPKDITTEIVLSKINAILTDNKYHNRAQELSSIFRDEPQHPLDKAVFWTEYVLRHKGAKHMLSPARHMTFCQYYMLDIAAFILAVVVVLLLTVYGVLRCCWRLVCGKSTKKTKKE